MEQTHIILPLFLLALIIYFILRIKERPAVLLAFIGRGTAGLVFIHVFNLFCVSRDVITHVNINPLTAAVSCLLGLPGVFLTYGIQLWGIR